MAKFIFFLLVAALVSTISADSQLDEYIYLKCVVLAPNKISVRLRKATVKTAIDVFDNKGVEAYKWHMKNVLKNIKALDGACLTGWMGETDYDTAVATFVAGIKEVKLNYLKLEASNFPYLYLATERGEQYRPELTLFNVGN